MNSRISPKGVRAANVIGIQVRGAIKGDLARIPRSGEKEGVEKSMGRSTQLRRGSSERTITKVTEVTVVMLFCMMRSYAYTRVVTLGPIDIIHLSLGLLTGHRGRGRACHTSLTCPSEPSTSSGAKMTSGGSQAALMWKSVRTA